MTNGQRQKIKTMRYQGLGYAKIAKAIGLSRDSVRNYCIREGLNGYASELVTEYREVLKEEMLFVFCLNCGIELEQKSCGRKRKYCSLSCKREWEKDHRTAYVLNCEYCGKEFKALGVSWRKFCSPECYRRDRFWREEDAAEVAQKILQFKKVNHLPMWLRELLLSDAEA